MKIPNNKKTQYGPNRPANGFTASGQGVDLVVGELKALLTCLQDTVFFRRFVSRTMMILKKEPRLKELWHLSAVHNKKIKAERELLLESLQKAQKALHLDAILPSLSVIYETINRDGARLLPKGQWKGTNRTVVPKGFSDIWVREIAAWLESQQEDPKNKHGAKLVMLRMNIIDWEEASREWYPIGDHPCYSLARLIYLEEWVLFFLEEEGLYEPVSRYFGPIEPSLLHTVVKEIRCEIEEAVQNLIAELPIIKSWGAFATSALAWQSIVFRGLFQIQDEDQKSGTITSAAAVAARLHPEVKGYGISLETVKKFVKTVGFRTRDDARQSQRRRKPKAVN